MLQLRNYYNTLPLFLKARRREDSVLFSVFFNTFTGRDRVGRDVHRNIVYSS